MSTLFSAAISRRWAITATLFGWVAACGTGSGSGSHATPGGSDGSSGNGAGAAQRAGAPGSSAAGAAALGGAGTNAAGANTAGQPGTAGFGGGASVAGGPGAAGASSAGAAGSSGAASAAGSPGAIGNTGGNGFYRMERLSRGLVAVTANGGVYVGWRMFGFEYDASKPANVSYNVYRDGAKIANVTDSTNYQDTAGTSSATYSVRPVIAGVEGAVSESAKVLAQQYLSVPLQVPAGGTTPASCPTASEAYTYSASDASPGDADGDGVYEIFLKWDPSNAKDNSQAGLTGNVFLDAYELNGTRLWRIDLGRNIRAGAHYTQFMVYDFDGDGKAEVMCKTADGTRSGTGQVIGDASADWRDITANPVSGRVGYVLRGPEFLTVFNGQTGAAMATTDYVPARGTVESWGDNYGNRVDRFLAGV
ncbi:MAG TPA: rhamnogalacturonan lyase, partial [Polyangiaceae bacterium]